MKTIRWGKSKEGYCDSKCGRFSISPQWCGRVNPVFWKLVDNKTKTETRCCSTQREAKEAAQRWSEGRG